MQPNGPQMKTIQIHPTESSVRLGVSEEEEMESYTCMKNGQGSVSNMLDMNHACIDLKCCDKLKRPFYLFIYLFIFFLFSFAW